MDTTLNIWTPHLVYGYHAQYMDSMDMPIVSVPDHCANSKVHAWSYAARFLGWKRHSSRNALAGTNYCFLGHVMRQSRTQTRA